MPFVRLKPYNGRQHVLRTYSVYGIKFQESRGWYEVDADVAAYCKKVKQKPDAIDAHLTEDAFDVVDTREAAAAIDENEKKKVERALAEHANKVSKAPVMARRASSAGDLTTRDLKGETTFDDLKDTFDDDMGGEASFPTKTVESADESTPRTSPQKGKKPQR